MKYLLSTGKSTEDVIIYIKDIILINLKLLPNEIPYWGGGSDELIKDVLEINLQSHIVEIVNNVINRISVNIPGIPISLNKIEITQRSVNIDISINGIIESYGIKRFNKEGIS